MYIENRDGTSESLNDLNLNFVFFSIFLISVFFFSVAPPFGILTVPTYTLCNFLCGPGLDLHPTILLLAS